MQIQAKYYTKAWHIEACKKCGATSKNCFEKEYDWDDLSLMLQILKNNSCKINF